MTEADCPTSTTEPCPDAELIALCDSLPRVFRDLAAAPDDLDDDAPEWRAYDRIVDAVWEIPATTMGGLIAKARAAKVKAERDGGGDATDPGGVPAVWAWSIVNDLCRMGGAS